MKIEVNDVSFYCETITQNTNAPWITFSHALANNLRVWDDVVAAFKSDYRILRYDQRGHGKTQAVPGPYNFPMLMKDVVGIWDQLGIDKSHWVGLSIGGMIGYGLAIASPDRLHSLVACDSRPDAPPDYAAYFQSRIDKTRDVGMAGVVDSTIARWFTEESIQKNIPAIDKVRAMILSTNPMGQEGCCKALQALSFGTRLHEISIPTLVIGGAKDKGAPPAILAEAAAKIPGARHSVVPDAGHIVAIENPSAFIAELKAFLAGLG